MPVSGDSGSGMIEGSSILNETLNITGKETHNVHSNLAYYVLFHMPYALHYNYL